MNHALFAAELDSEIRARHRAGRLVSLAALVTGCALLASSPPSRSAPPSEGEEPSVLVQTAPVKSGVLPQVVVAYGVAKTTPGMQHSLVAHASTVITAVRVRVGEAVRAGDPLLELSPTPSTRAAYLSAVSAEHTAAQALSRMHRLLADSLATEQQLAEATKADADARATLRALEAQGARGPSVLRAPFDAVVTAVTAAPDAIVAEGAPLMELARSNGLILLAGVAPSLAGTVNSGNPVRIEPVGAEKAFEGHVSLRGAMVDAASGLVPVNVSIPEHSLLPGQMARASITTGEAHGFLVPHAATLVNDRGEAYVVQARSGAARIVPVQILATRNDEDAISGPIDPASPVIVAGNHQLEDGMKVRYGNEAASPGR